MMPKTVRAAQARRINYFGQRRFCETTEEWFRIASNQIEGRKIMDFHDSTVGAKVRHTREKSHPSYFILAL
jgi:hypothetical protein